MNLVLNCLIEKTQSNSGLLRGFFDCKEFKNELILGDQL